VMRMQGEVAEERSCEFRLLVFSPSQDNVLDTLLRLAEKHHRGEAVDLSIVVLDVDLLCIYPDRYRTKCCRNLRFEPQFCEGFGFAHLAYWVSSG
jgi:hypothetical protein